MTKATAKKIIHLYLIHKTTIVLSEYLSTKNTWGLNIRINNKALQALVLKQLSNSIVIECSRNKREIQVMRKVSWIKAATCFKQAVFFEASHMPPQTLRTSDISSCVKSKRSDLL